MNSYSVNLQFVPLDSVRFLLMILLAVGVAATCGLFWLVRDIGEIRESLRSAKWVIEHINSAVDNLSGEVSDALEKFEEEKE